MNRPRARTMRIAGLLLPVLLAACTAGPEYVKPTVDMPAAWKVEAPWRESRSFARAKPYRLNRGRPRI